jgi:hypothetical protein
MQLWLARWLLHRPPLLNPTTMRLPQFLGLSTTSSWTSSAAPPCKPNGNDPTLCSLSVCVWLHLLSLGREPGGKSIPLLRSLTQLLKLGFLWFVCQVPSAMQRNLPRHTRCTERGSAAMDCNGDANVRASCE